MGEAERAGQRLATAMAVARLFGWQGVYGACRSDGEASRHVPFSREDEVEDEPRRRQETTAKRGSDWWTQSDRSFDTRFAGIAIHPAIGANPPGPYEYIT